MILTGRNEIHYCPAALMEIIARHLNTTQGKTNDPKIKVSSLTISANSTGGTPIVVVQVTTDEPKEVT